MSRKTVQKFVVLAAVASIAVVGCGNPFGADGGGGGDDGGGSDDDTLTITGQLANIGTQSASSGGLSTLSDDPDDWVLVALSWGPDFVPPDIMRGMETADHANELDFDFWEDDHVIEVDDNGSFSWQPPSQHQFVLFAVDLSDEIDPVRGLIGIGAREDEDLVWQALNEDFLSGEVSLGEIAPPEDGGIVWTGETDAESLVENGNLGDSDLETVLELAYFDDGVGMLKNQLSTGYNIERDGLTERDQRVFFVLDSDSGAEKEGNFGEDFGDGAWLYLGDHIGEEYRGYAVRYFAKGLDDGSSIAFSPPADVSYDDQDGNEDTLEEGKYLDGILSEHGEIENLYSGVLSWKEGSSYVFHSHLAGSWTVELDGQKYGISLDSTFDEISGSDGSYPLPVPAMKVTLEDDAVQALEVEWFQHKDGQRVPIDTLTLRNVFPSYAVWFQEDDTDEIFTELLSSPANVRESISADELDEDWSFSTDAEEDENLKKLVRITMIGSPAMTGVAPTFSWASEDW